MSLVVESRMGAVAWGLWPTPRFPSPRSSNRACRFPAPGFPTGFTARHTTAGRSLLVSGDDTSARDGLRQAAQLYLDLRSPSQGARLPTPVAAKAGPVPTHERLGLDDCEDLQD